MLSSCCMSDVFMQRGVVSNLIRVVFTHHRQKHRHRCKMWWSAGTMFPETIYAYKSMKDEFYNFDNS